VGKRACNTGVVFQLKRPGTAELESAFEAACWEKRGGAGLLSLSTGLVGGTLPAGFAHDHLRLQLGAGEAAFAAARRAFTRWTQFDLGWVRVANPEAGIRVGQVVAVEVRALGLWSLNLSRIVETVDSPTRFGFVYATTEHHAEQGEEIFVLEFDPTEGSVAYLLEAVSRPRHALARLAYPLTRALQHQFARDSQRRMRAAVLDELGDGKA
jgi:uncharacterized protein (UPF0548 family)